MKVQKTFRGKTSGQWLSKAEICESKAGMKEIFVDDGIVAGYHPDGMLLSSAGGSLAVLALGKIQNERFCEMCEIRDDNA